MMLNITLKQLRYFDALARLGHFGRAADECSVTQPALSMQIKELEDSVGVTLFERSSRHVRLTGFGEVFAIRAQAIMRDIDELQDLARSAGDRLEGILRIGVIPTIAPYLLPRVIGALGASHPNLELTFRETVTSRLIDSLQDGKLDAAIVALPVSEPSLSEMPLLTENFVLVRPIKDAQKPVPNREGLQEMRLLLLEEGHCFREQALSFCSFPTSKPREMMDGSSLATLVQMVGAGIGITLIPEMAVPIETLSAPVAITHFPAPEPSRTIGMVWRKSSPLARQLQDIGEVVRSVALQPR